ncbi:hypothetical protein C8R42DRAFT_639033 [Lentinula raphanica]|nr:hypothetical protein C8R42DRAFT_639033 [Lentinula raphanica]
MGCRLCIVIKDNETKWIRAEDDESDMAERRTEKRECEYDVDTSEPRGIVYRKERGRHRVVVDPGGVVESPRASTRVNGGPVGLRRVTAASNPLDVPLVVSGTEGVIQNMGCRLCIVIKDNETKWIRAEDDESDMAERRTEKRECEYDVDTSEPRGIVYRKERG